MRREREREIHTSGTEVHLAMANGEDPAVGVLGSVGGQIIL